MSPTDDRVPGDRRSDDPGHRVPGDRPGPAGRGPAGWAAPGPERWDRLVRLAPAMLDRLHRRTALLLGETAVVSTCVHVLKSSAPGVVTILRDSDAGRTFYQRARSGEVLHIDVFHEPGEVDHRLVAARVRSAAGSYTRRAWGTNPGRGTLEDYIDVQTATGGGRITGSLRYGRKATLMRAHRNHVHVAMLLMPADLPSVFPILAAVEQAVLDSGLELRRVEGVAYEQGGTSSLPLSDYTSQTDSYLRDRVRGEGSGDGPGEAGGAHRDGDGGGAAHAPGDAVGHGAAELHAAALGLARQLGSEEQVQALMELLAAAPTLREVMQELQRRGLDTDAVESLLAELRRSGFVDYGEGSFRLTGRGRRLAEYVARHRHELRLALRKAMRRTVQRDASRAGRGLTLGRADPLGQARSRRAAPPEPGVPLQDVAWPESVTAAAARAAAARTAEQRGGRGPGRIALQPEDLRVLRRRHRRPVDVCLLIDASASMAGERMRAAKTLARHLLASTRDRVAVVVFQERQVRISVPFTRNDVRVEQGLATIRPYGLTPLATGLAAAREYLRTARPRNPLLLLITDGIPTVPHDGTNPLDDALDQAARWRGSRVSFTCVGLQPNERYLRGLVEAAGGTLHIVDELEADTLVAIATAERQRRARPARRA